MYGDLPDLTPLIPVLIIGLIAIICGMGFATYGLAVLLWNGAKVVFGF